MGGGVVGDGGGVVGGGGGVIGERALAWGLDVCGGDSRLDGLDSLDGLIWYQIFSNYPFNLKY